jgi:hypothetical protein
VKVYVASTGRGRWALDGEKVIAVCEMGPFPLSDAKSYALDHTKKFDERAYVYEVDLKEVGSYRVHKEVVFGAPE